MTKKNENSKGAFNKILADWESLALRQLFCEYNHILRTHHIPERPVLIELCDSEVYWGLWRRDTVSIVLSRKLLLTQPWHFVLGVLKHEMAHQMVDEGVFIDRSSAEWVQWKMKWAKKEDEASSAPLNRPHGEKFKDACRRLGVPAEFAKATTHLQEASLDWRTQKCDEGTERLLERVRKLLALASSSNEHEALLAMSRVREIYAKYNLDSIERTLSENGESKTPFVQLVIIDRRKRIESFEKKIVSILIGHFFVKAIFSRGYDVQSGQFYQTAELIGTRENVLMAEYVFGFLNQQSEYLVRHSRGLDRKSMRLGILDGFVEKLLQLSEEAASGNAVHRALVEFKSDMRINQYIEHLYPRLTNVRSKRQAINRSVYAEGKAIGRQLTLHKPVTSERGVNHGRVLSGR
jgi:hypothetical protein